MRPAPANQNIEQPEWDWMVITVWVIFIAGLLAFWIGFIELASFATTFIKP